MKISLRLFLVAMLLTSCIILSSGCATVHGVGEDVDTLGRGISGK
jgi:predicted small secreted protein